MLYSCTHMATVGVKELIDASSSVLGSRKAHDINCFLRSPLLYSPTMQVLEAPLLITPPSSVFKQPFNLTTEKLRV